MTRLQKIISKVGRLDWKLFSDSFLANKWAVSMEMKTSSEVAVCALRSVWPDLANFHHLCKYLKIFGNIFKVYLVWCKVFNSLRHNLYVIGQMSLLKMAKYWKHNLAIWSHCLCTPIETMIIVTSSRQPLFVKWLKIPRILRALRFSSVRVVRPRFKVVRPGS